MFGISTQIITEALATEWVKHFRRNPFVTSAATLTAIAIFVVIVINVDAYQKEARQTARLENASYKDQVDRLNEMETNVTQLLSFIEGQKQTLNATQDTILKLEINTDAVRDALRGNTDVRVVKDYRNIPVLSAYTPLENLRDVNWVLLVEIDMKEAFYPVLVLKTNLIIISTVISVITAVYLYFTLRKRHSEHTP